MSSPPFHYIDLRTFCYETEDRRRVEQALRRFLPEDTEIEREETEGHHGDRILVFSVRVERADEMRHVLAQVQGGIDRDRLLAEVDDRVDEDCSLHLHLDKQAAYRDEVQFGDGVALRAKVEAYPAERVAAVENAREAFTG